MNGGGADAAKRWRGPVTRNVLRNRLTKLVSKGINTMKTIQIKTVHLFLLISLCIPSICVAVSNDILIRSAEIIVSDWTKLLSSDHKFVSGENNVWGVYRSVLMQPLSYDIQQTNSIVSPYLLIIYGKSKWEHNFDSKHSDKYSEVFESNFGFKTQETALINIFDDDFGVKAKRIYDFKIYYSYQNGFWILKNTCSDFNEFVNENSSKGIKIRLPVLERYKVEKNK